MSTQRDEEVSVAHLIEEAFEGAKDLAAAEGEEILIELGEEAARVRRIAMLGGAAATIGTAGLAWLGVAVVMALGAGWMGMLITAGVALAVAAGLGFAASRIVPEITMARTRRRIADRAERVIAAAKDDPTPLHGAAS